MASPQAGAAAASAPNQRSSRTKQPIGSSWPPLVTDRQPARNGGYGWSGDRESVTEGDDGADFPGTGHQNAGGCGSFEVSRSCGEGEVVAVTVAMLVISCPLGGVLVRAARGQGFYVRLGARDHPRG